MPSPTLIIGYGSQLRGDDAVGIVTVDALASLDLPQTRCLTCHQLTPELATDLAPAGRVIFVDACFSLPDSPPQPRIQRVYPSPSPTGYSTSVHHATPTGLLDLCYTLHGQAPEAWLVAIPGAHFDTCLTLSPSAQQALHHARHAILNLLDQPKV
ncbi:MAG TPA: hydrogenase maturation protease [Kiritimatiellia bacterium]|nr:hydrogenase maturation protease [Kiritimatiellia bacterium]